MKYITNFTKERNRGIPPSYYFYAIRNKVKDELEFKIIMDEIRHKAETTPYSYYECLESKYYQLSKIKKDIL